MIGRSDFLVLHFFPTTIPMFVDFLHSQKRVCSDLSFNELEKISEEALSCSLKGLELLFLRFTAMEFEHISLQSPKLWFPFWNWRSIDPFHACRDTAKCLIYWKKKLTIKFVTSKLVKLAIFNVLALKLAKKLIFKSRQLYKEMYGGRALHALRASLSC